MDDEVKILICCHKETNTCNDNIYLPIQVGHAFPKVYDPQEVLYKSSNLNSSVCNEWNKVIDMI